MKILLLCLGLACLSSSAPESDPQLCIDPATGEWIACSLLDPSLQINPTADQPSDLGTDTSDQTCPRTIRTPGWNDLYWQANSGDTGLIVLDVFNTPDSEITSALNSGSLVAFFRAEGSDYAPTIEIWDTGCDGEGADWRDLQTITKYTAEEAKRETERGGSAMDKDFWGEVFSSGVSNGGGELAWKFVDEE